MKRKILTTLLVLVLVFAVLASTGCKPKKAALGTADNPIKLYFVPSVEVSVIVESGDAMTQWIEEQTGLKFEVRVPTTYAAVVEEMGAAEGDAMAFIPAMGYVLASDRYGMQVSLATERYGWGYYWTEYVVRRDSGITSIEDLDGKSWAYPSVTSTSGYLVPASYFAKHGIEPGDEFDAGGHPQAVAAVYEGQADFATVYFSAPGDNWQIGDPPEPEGEWTYKEVEGRLQAFKGGQRIRDARAAMLDTYNDVCEVIGIVGLSDPIPNDTVSFSKDFPEDIREKVVQALLDYAQTDEGQAVLANDKFYDITGFTRVDDSQFDPIRDMISGLGLAEEDILE